jgi:hypothetical protein
VISAWFFSLYINDLISELKAVNSGISISDLNIPAILLADSIFHSLPVTPKSFNLRKSPSFHILSKAF